MSAKADVKGLKVPPPAGPLQLLTVAEVAALLRVEVSTLYVWTSKRKIPFRKVGGRLRFDRDEILRWTMPAE
jgi:excisionase family DNA binding protein